MTASIIRDIDRPENSHRIDELTLISPKGTESYNILPTLVKLTVFEDLFFGGIEATLIFNDENDLASNVPLIGRGEKVVFKFSNRNDTDSAGENWLPNYELTLSVNKMISHYRDKVTMKMVTVLELTDESYIKDSTVRIIRSYGGSIDNIITDVLKTVDVELVECDSALHSKSFIFQDDRPMNIVHKIKNYATAEKDDCPNMVLYQDVEGWKFKSLYDLMMKPPVATLTYNIDHINSNFNRHNMLYHHADNRFTGTELQKMLINNESKTHKMSTKAIAHHQYDYKQYYEHFKPMNANGISYFIEDDLYDKGDIQGYMLYDINDEYLDDLTSTDVNQCLQQGLQRDLLSLSTATARLSGSPDIWVGHTVDVDYQTTDGQGGQEVFNSGIHLVIRVKHEITLIDYFTTIEMCKDSYKPTDRKLP